jgi:nucleotide-binding universal stress UspA family protein
MKGDLMPGPILCGVDDSTGARDAVVAASAISIRAALPLMFVHVAPDESRLSRRDPERKRRIGESVAVAIEMLGRATSRLPSGHGAITRVALGDPAEQLAAVAAASGAEMVVVGSRGRRRVRAAVLGSVSRALTVLRAASRERAELLVLGLHADRPVLRRSVAGALLASSPVPILIVPSPGDLARGATGPAGEPEHVASAA